MAITSYNYLLRFSFWSSPHKMSLCLIELSSCTLKLTATKCITNKPHSQFLATSPLRQNKQTIYVSVPNAQNTYACTKIKGCAWQGTSGHPHPWPCPLTATSGSPMIFSVKVTLPSQCIATFPQVLEAADLLVICSQAQSVFFLKQLNAFGSAA